MTDVTVVMAAHDEQRYIERAIRSCLEQSHPAKIVVINDGSEDRTGEIAKRFPADRVTVVTHHEQRGLPAAVNTGIRFSSSRYIVRVDADDYIHHDLVYALRLYLELNEDVQAVACDYILVDDQERHLARVSAETVPIGCGVMFRKQALIDIGLYDESFLMAEDLDLRLRFTKKWPVHHLRIPLYRYRKHPDNMTANVAAHTEFQIRALAA